MRVGICGHTMGLKPQDGRDRPSKEALVQGPADLTSSQSFVIIRVRGEVFLLLKGVSQMLHWCRSEVCVSVCEYMCEVCISVCDVVCVYMYIYIHVTNVYLYFNKITIIKHLRFLSVCVQATVQSVFHIKQFSQQIKQRYNYLS